ncbi:Lactoylglutathione lyase [Rhizophlyctis rosea]|nr:Lactoylglutathione lyase [Rhizophlyctis rosea]
MPSATQPAPYQTPKPGTDAPQPPPTYSFKLNHVCVRVKDMETSLKFYRDCLGMRTVFTLNSDSYNMIYLGYPEREEDGKEETGEEMLKNRLRRTGLLELKEVLGKENATWTGHKNTLHPYHSGFCHLGLTVSDAPACMARIKKAGYKIIKDVGEAPSAKMFGFAEDTPELNEWFKKAVTPIGFVEDPDGYWVEVVPNHSDACC